MQHQVCDVLSYNKKAETCPSHSRKNHLVPLFSEVIFDSLKASTFFYPYSEFIVIPQF